MPRALSNEKLDDFRARTCEVATRLFREHGLAGVTMRQIAAELQCSPMLPYRYFADREDILASVRARAFRTFSDALERAYASGTDARSRSRALSDEYLNFALSHPAEFGLMFDVTQPDAHRYPQLSEAIGRSRALITKRFENLVAEGIVAGDPEEMGLAFWATAHGVVVLHLTGKLPPGRDVRAFFETVMATLFRGFRHAKSAANKRVPA